MSVRFTDRGRQTWGARASRMLVSVSRRNKLSLCGVPLVSNAPRKVSDREDAFVNTRDACAAQKGRRSSRLSPYSSGEDQGEGSERTCLASTLILPLSLRKREATRHTRCRTKLSA